MNAQLPLEAPFIKTDSRESEDRFDWCDDTCICVQPQPAIAVFRNRGDAITILQEPECGVGPDVSIVVQPQNARAVAEAILKALAEFDQD